MSRVKVLHPTKGFRSRNVQPNPEIKDTDCALMAWFKSACIIKSLNPAKPSHDRYCRYKKYPKGFKPSRAV